MHKYFLLIIFLAVLLEAFADILFKKWALHEGFLFLPIGVGLYAIGTIAWAYSLKFEFLSKAISVFTVLNLIVVVLAGVVFFKENLSFQNKIGILLGIVSVLLLEF